MLCVTRRLVGPLSRRDERSCETPKGVAMGGPEHPCLTAEHELQRVGGLGPAIAGAAVTRTGPVKVQRGA